MKLWRFEGSPEEFGAVASVLMAEGGAVIKSEEINEQPEDKRGGRKYVTVAQAKEILTRRELSDGLANVLRALMKSDKKMLSDDLREINDHSSDQFRGLMGAFGRRVVNTVGNSFTWFFETEWNHSRHQNTYGLPATVRQAIEELDIL